MFESLTKYLPALAAPKPSRRRSRPKRVINEVANDRSCVSVLLGFVIWALAGFDLGYFMVGYVGRPMLIGFFIASVFAPPFLFPNFFAALGLLLMHDDRSKPKSYAAGGDAWPR